MHTCSSPQGSTRSAGIQRHTATAETHADKIYCGLFAYFLDMVCDQRIQLTVYNAETFLLRVRKPRTGFIARWISLKAACGFHGYAQYMQGKSEGKSPLGRTRRRWRAALTVRRILRKWGVRVSQDKAHCRSAMNTAGITRLLVLWKTGNLLTN